MNSKQRKSVIFNPRGKKSRFGSLFIYEAVRFTWRFMFMFLFGARLHSYRKLLRNRSYIFLCNHQSFLDPVVFPTMSLGTFSFAARHTLFRNPMFAKLITFLGAFPIHRGARNNEAFNLMAIELEAGSSLIIFPEGTRSIDGTIKKFKGGVEIILRKTKAPVQIAVVSGDHKILPKYGKLTKFNAHPMNVIFAEPIMADEYLKAPSRMIAELLETKTRDLYQELHRKPYLQMRGITAISQVVVEVFNLYANTILQFFKLLKRKKVNK